METNQVINKKNYPLVDILKFCFAILIMIHHAEVVSANNYFTQIVIRLAVPFFFIASGFFYGIKIYRNKDDLKVITFSKKGYVNRLLKMLLIFEPINIVLVSIKYIIKGLSIGDIFLEIGKSIIFYPKGALWYIQATIIAILLLYLFIKTNKEFLIIPLGILLYLPLLLMNNYFFIISNTSAGSFVNKLFDIIISPRNGLFIGFLFVGIGVIFAKWNNVFDNKLFLAIILLVICLGLYITEIILIHDLEHIDDRGYFLLTPFVSSALFLFSIQFSWPINTKIFRNLSTSIYLLHSPVLTCWDYGFYGLEKLNGFTCPSFLLFICSAVSLSIFLFFIYWKKPKYIYNAII